MLEKFIEGVRVSVPDAEIENVFLFPMDFKGCRSCFGCKLKNSTEKICKIKDGAYELIRDIKNADGFIYASPIYYFDVSASLRALLERIFYSGKCEKHIPVACIYTMNQPEKVMEERFRTHLNDLKMFIWHTFSDQADEVFAFETLHWDHPENYVFDDKVYEQRAVRAEKEFLDEQNNAYETGIRYGSRVKEAYESNRH